MTKVSKYDVYNTIVGYIWDYTDEVYGGLCEEDLYNYIIDEKWGDIINKHADAYTDTMKKYFEDESEVHVPEFHNYEDVNNFYESISDIDDYVDIFNEADTEFIDTYIDNIINKYDSNGRYVLPRDVADFYLGDNGPQEIADEMNASGNMSEYECIRIFEEKYLPKKGLYNATFDVVKTYI